MVMLAPLYGISVNLENPISRPKTVSIQLNYVRQEKIFKIKVTRE